MPCVSSTPTSPRISFSVVGTGPDHIIFLAGMCVARDAWQAQLDFLSMNPRFTLLLPDNRGAGESEAPAFGYDLDAMAADAWAVLDAAAGSSSRAHVVGHSMGAMIAARAALSAPHRVCSLSLLSGHAGGWWWSNVPSAALVHAAFALALAFGDGRAVAVAEIGLRLHYTDAFLDELVVDDVTARKARRRARYLQRYAEGARADALRDPDGDVFWGQLDAIRRYELSPEDCLALKFAQFRTVVVYGEHDEVVPPGASVELAAKIGAQRFQVPGRHFIADESSHDVNAILLRHFGLSNEGLNLSPRLEDFEIWEKPHLLMLTTLC